MSVTARQQVSPPHRARRTLAGIALGLAFTGCGTPPSPFEHRFFPLAPGSHWQYRVERTTMDGKSELRYAISVVPAGTGSAPAMTARETMDGHRYYYESNSDGVYRIGERRRGTDIIEYHADRRLILPRTLEPTQQWRSMTSSSVLENTGTPWETLFRITVPVELHYRIESVSETVQTPAGRFTGCLLLAGRGITHTDVGNYIGRTGIEITTREWFAPDVGLVRLERTETTTSPALNFGSLRMELDRVEKE